MAAADAVAAAGRWWLGAAVLDRDTGQVVAGVRGNEPDYAASLSKLLVAGGWEGARDRVSAAALALVRALVPA